MIRRVYSGSMFAGKQSHQSDTRKSVSTVAAICLTAGISPTLFDGVAYCLKPLACGVARESLVDDGIAYVHKTQEDYQDRSVPILESDLELPLRCFSREFLKDIRVARVRELPLPESRYIEVARAIYPDKIVENPVALCVGNVIFIREDIASPELTAVHELIHTWQMRRIGEENFVRLYLFWGMQGEYTDIPFEKMAYKLTAYVKRASCQGAQINLEAICELEFSKFMSTQDLVEWPDPGHLPGRK